MKTAKFRNDFKERLTSIIGHEKPFAWAKRIGLPSATFSRIWNGGIAPKPDTLLLIAEKTGVCIDWLLTGEGPSYRNSACEAVERRNAFTFQGLKSEAHRRQNLEKCLEILTGLYDSGHQELVEKLAAELTACGKLAEQWNATSQTAESVKELEVKLNRMEKRLAALEKMSPSRK